MPNGDRREWVKPIMFSGGIGSMEDMHIKKLAPEIGKRLGFDTLWLTWKYMLK